MSNNYRLARKGFRVKKKQKQGIYIIIDKQNNCIKIGVSSVPKQRLKDLQTGNPFKLELLYYKKFGKAYEVESTLHIEFENRYKRMEGEWFDIGDSTELDYIVSLIDSLPIHYYLS